MFEIKAREHFKPRYTKVFEDLKSFHNVNYF